MRVLFLLFIVLFLTGCGDDSNIVKPENYNGKADWYLLPDGRKVLCIFEKRGYGAGLSCDWDNATK